MSFRKTGHKFGVSPKEERTVDGIVFDSKAEAKRYRELKLLEAAGEIQHLQRQVRFDWMTDCCIEDWKDTKHVKRRNHYKADFTYVLVIDGVPTQIVEDVKGQILPEFKRKKKIVETLYGITITIT